MATNVFEVTWENKNSVYRGRGKWRYPVDPRDPNNAAVRAGKALVFLAERDDNCNVSVEVVVSEEDWWYCEDCQTHGFDGPCKCYEPGENYCAGRW